MYLSRNPPFEPNLAQPHQLGKKLADIWHFFIDISFVIR